MSLFERFSYSIGLAIVLIAVTVLPLMIGAADGIDLLPKSTFKFIFSPWYYIAAYAIAFLLAPWASQYLNDRGTEKEAASCPKAHDSDLPFARYLSVGTARWSRLAPAWHLVREALWSIVRLAGQAHSHPRATRRAAPAALASPAQR